MPVSGGADPMLAALRATAWTEDAGAVAVAAGEMAVAISAGVSSGPIGQSRDRGSNATLEASVATGSAYTVGEAGGTLAGDTVGETGETSGPCGALRRLADERCELATRARSGAGVAENDLRAAQRAHNEHEAAADAAAATADTRSVRRAKDEAQARFRSSRADAMTQSDVEAAARAWLLDINTINGAAREALATLTSERDAAKEIAASLERLALGADAARIGAEIAEAACLSAREAAADCDEREQAGARGEIDDPPPTGPGDGAAANDGNADGMAVALDGDGSPRIFRLLGGDRAAMSEMVTTLAGDDPVERRRWQVAMSDLVDAILADSIAAGALDFPSDHPFWGPFTLEQDRQVASALSSLGYRFDGLGGWVDGRVPTQRDLSMALGYAGLDPMRQRHWPTDAEMTDLYRDVEVAAAEHLVSAAGDLTLGELVSMLGRRADGLAEIWNEWGRIRPLLLEDA